ncbi:protein pitchfork-like isoform X1 [Gadus macrocephalus]|uniref:protein pitchfork-like isoform X1 n=1 Tax=Gadus macrocephalus TaxID=80720 RepID=UPI0028CB767C|nr:protein pitchfork-like isoform X1 [Gadus macrocephalus]
MGTISKLDEPGRRRGVGFGTSQDRKLFPTNFAPNRLGNQMFRKEEPHRGPGCYENHEFRSMMYDIQKRPMCKKGYVLSARTAVRFLEANRTVTPSPQKYQQDQSRSRILPPGKTPFNSSAVRVTTKPDASLSMPGPGTYSHEVAIGRKVVWPMSFGSPDWVKFPQLKKKTLRAELQCDKDFKKHRARVAYLRMYF